MLLRVHVHLQVVLDWLAKLLGLPPAFLTVQPDSSKGAGGGVIQGTASEATLVALLAARAQTMTGRDAADALGLVAYTSDQAWHGTGAAVLHLCILLGCHSMLCSDLWQSGKHLQVGR